ncbi:uncharacterized protein G2W53_042253 [Senna tora]|uniref:Uncharacterized protein n=1 Tax=Senna tora TaxID=362788 RepID=A0A834SGQ5_9FABA|nr:uncharacterized protein G2W53_042253 [Senna tora]
MHAKSDSEVSRGAVMEGSTETALLRSKPIQPRCGENVIRLQPFGFPSSLLLFLSHSSLSRVLHLSILRLPQKP